MIANLSGGHCCGGGALVRFDAALPVYARWILRLWNWLAVRRKLAAGCFIFCLREGCEEIGGFNERLFASEEIWFSKRLRKWGGAKGLEFTIIPAPPIVTSARKMQDHPLRNFLALCFVLAFPVAVFSRRLSYLWYYRKG